MKPVVLAMLGAVLSVLAFPPFGPGILIFPGVTLFLVALRMVESGRRGLLVGTLYGLVFFAGLMWWLAELELLALVLVPVQAVYMGVFGWGLARYRNQPPDAWLALCVGWWALLELIRYRFPVGGLEWGAAGYALADNDFLRLPASAVGTSGLTVLVVMTCGIAALTISRSWDNHLLWSVSIVGLVVLATIPSVLSHADSAPRTVAIVQGSTPCPFEHCPPDERLRTFEQHLELTKTIEPGSVDLVVWSEGSTGATNADPVLNEEVGEAIGEQARRIGAPMLVGGDRTVSDTEWINANVYFTAEGEIVGEYRKQHPVPFGEYVPWRPLFGWIPALERVPRDMIRGDGPVVFDEEGLGSVISFEGGFSRYTLRQRRAGAHLIVVATNEASYGPNAPTSDQFIGMTRMRAVELGVPIVHAAVTGKSTVIDRRGRFSATTGLGTEEIFYDEIGESSTTPYAAIGDLVMWLAVVVGVLMWVRVRRLLVSATNLEEE